MNSKVFAIDHKSPYLAQVKKLGDENSATLGFFPNGAFDDFASRKQIIIALDSQNKCIGYLLYRISYGRVIIIHLCVSINYRKKGIAQALVNFLKNNTKKYEGIGLSCRRDYSLEKMWQKFGFIPLSERPGRGKKDKTLTYWWYDHGHPTLFTIADEKKIQSKLAVVLDANTFFHLKGHDTPYNTESKALQADWLEDEIELCLTKELFNEINRNIDPEEREKNRRFAHFFTILETKYEIVEAISKNLKKYFKKPLSKRDKSDIRHLSHAIAKNVQFFITQDDGLLKQSDKIYNDFNLNIIRPCNLIIQLDELRRIIDYQPKRLAGTISSIRLVKNEDINKLVEIFFSKSPKEKKSQFRKTLHNFLSQPDIYETKTIIDSNNNFIALITCGRGDEKVLDIPLIRVRQNSLSKTLSEHLILEAVLTSSMEKRFFIKVSDQYISPEIIESLIKNYFYYSDNFWTKLSISGAKKLKNLIKEFQSLNTSFPKYNKFIYELIKNIKLLSLNLSTYNLLKFEKTLWPLKIIDLNIPCFIIPIKPSWAMHLFDKHLASQDLFGAMFKLVINRENIYYRSKKPQVLKAPARILWYVSHDKNIKGSKQLRACSYLDQVFIEKPKELFKLFKNLGIYEWKDIYKIAKGNINNQIMAFKFCTTELFSNPLNWEELKNILFEEIDRKSPIQSPVEISNSCFFRIYNLGTQ